MTVWGYLSIMKCMYVCRFYINHRTNISLGINCCTTLLTLAIQSLRVCPEVTLEPVIEGEATLRYEFLVVLNISRCFCCISIELLRCFCSVLLHPYLYCLTLAICVFSCL
jgi:hypothetical protein